MKNILNKIGAVSKPVIFGAALGVATVAVGIGVATNLMSDGPKGVSGRVLGQYNADTASVGSGGGYDAFSKEALEQQMAAAQAAREGGTALDYLGAAGKNRFAYGNNASSYEGGVVDPMAMNNAAYDAQEGAAVSGMPADIGAAMSQFNATAAAVSAKAGKGGVAAVEEEGAGTQKGALEKAEASGTQLNKLNRSNMLGGSSSSGSFGGSGGSYNMGSIMGAPASDRPAQQAVPSVNMPKAEQGNISGIEGAKHGRLGAMGGSNSRGGTSGNGGSGQAYFTSTMGELVSAQRYSALAKGTVYGDSEKGFVEAGAAFDGSGEVTEGTQIDGSTPMIEKAATLDREATKINNKNNTKPIDNITAETNQYQESKKQLMWATLAMVAATAGVAIALAAMPGATPWGLVAKIAVMLAGIAGIWVIYGTWMLKHINMLKGLKYMTNPAGSWPWLAPTLAGLCTAALGIAFFSKQIGAKLSSWSAKLAQGGKFSQWLGKGIGSIGKFLSGGAGAMAKGAAKAGVTAGAQAGADKLFSA